MEDSERTKRREAMIARRKERAKRNEARREALKIKSYNSDNPIFIHVPKTGGRYLGRSLSQCKIDFARTGHQKASYIVEKTKGSFHDRFSFACVRNPYERFLSGCRFNRIKDFEQRSIDLLDPSHKVNRAVHFHTQKSMVSDHNGKIIVKYIGRFEKFDEFVEGLKENGLDITSVYEFKECESSDWRTALTEKTKENIREIYKEDFIAFGYDF